MAAEIGGLAIAEGNRREERVLPILPPAADDVGAAFEDAHHGGNVARIVLKVPSSYDEPAARVGKAGSEMRRSDRSCAGGR